ncbi:hypothetical protein QBC46DRAFT_406447 [Diplogelasinospora grovesii]|uniref:Uncharacterized protein n=1 Tax=Diplogelasinospora grovesii TaxID=303347 RepID=A0AAN6S6V5_9PEZI|nr:hypothetical protein QBC46DRAFT_406447 [Diplogelasinospora grovesii]
MPTKKRAGKVQVQVAAPRTSRKDLNTKDRDSPYRKSQAVTTRTTRSGGPSHPAANGARASPPPKRKQAEDGDEDDHTEEERILKKTRIASTTRTTTSGSRQSGRRRRVAPHEAGPPRINQAPTDVLAVLVFGNGHCGELGLGPVIYEIYSMAAVQLRQAMGKVTLPSGEAANDEGERQALDFTH